MNLSPRPVRMAAAVGACLVAGTTTFVALTAGTASADEPGRCTQNVNVREDPDATSRIVALCDAGTQVKLGEERDGFVHLDELGGWASKDFVKADEQAADDSSSDSSSDEHGSDAASSDDHGSDASSSDEHASSHDGDSHDAESGDDHSGDHSGDAADADSGDPDGGPADQTQTMRRVNHGPLGGLLG